MRLDAPAGTALPLLVDCPHSGRDYPPDFDHAIARRELRRLEDAYVDRLCARAPEIGAMRLVATFPRSYIDVNRAEDDLDPTLLDTPWPAGLRPGVKCELGVGLVARGLPGAPIYDRLLGVAEVRSRIERCYRPYHRALADALDGLGARFGVAYHLDLHSMPAGDEDLERPDFCVGDADGGSCESGYTELVREWLHGRGFRVVVNDPYPGAEIIRRHGCPAKGRHSLQIEINRGLYLDEREVAPAAGFARTADLITGLMRAVGEYASARATR